MKPANSKARALLAKLEALAERGVDGERAAAKRSIRRLKARFDFTKPEPPETPDLFSGVFRRGNLAVEIHFFDVKDFDIANCVKWAIESAARIPCSYRHGHLLFFVNNRRIKKNNSALTPQFSTCDDLHHVEKSAVQAARALGP
jgi:hypothetical protein